MAMAFAGRWLSGSSWMVMDDESLSLGQHLVNDLSLHDDVVDYDTEDACVLLDGGTLNVTKYTATLRTASQATWP